MPNTNYILTPNGGFISEDELYHYGIPGMKWGVRKRVENVYTGAINRIKRTRQDISSGARATLKRYKGNRGKAIAKTVRKTALTSIGTRLGASAVSRVLRGVSSVASAGGHSGLSSAMSTASSAVMKGSKVANALILAGGAVKIHDIYEQGKPNKKRER